MIDKTKGQRMQSCQGPVDIYLGRHTIPLLLTKIFMAAS